jgi:hypothetical protein
MPGRSSGLLCGIAHREVIEQGPYCDSKAMWIIGTQRKDQARALILLGSRAKSGRRAFEGKCEADSWLGLGTIV